MRTPPRFWLCRSSRRALAPARLILLQARLWRRRLLRPLVAQSCLPPELLVLFPDHAARVGENKRRPRAALAKERAPMLTRHRFASTGFCTQGYLHENARLSARHCLRDCGCDVLHDAGRVVADLYARLYRWLRPHSYDPRHRRRGCSCCAIRHRLDHGPALTVASSRGESCAARARRSVPH